MEHISLTLGWINNVWHIIHRWIHGKGTEYTIEFCGWYTNLNIEYMEARYIKGVWQCHSFAIEKRNNSKYYFSSLFKYSAYQQSLRS